jgi:hypothetical protein
VPSSTSDQPKHRQSAVSVLFKYLYHHFYNKEKSFLAPFEFTIEDYYVTMALKMSTAVWPPAPDRTRTHYRSLLSYQTFTMSRETKIAENIVKCMCENARNK